jgi:hypothetical protein
MRHLIHDCVPPPQEIFGACEKAMAVGQASWLTCLDYLTASTEYESFMDIAYDHACMLGMGDVDDGEGLLEDDESAEEAEQEECDEEAGPEQGAKVEQRPTEA